MKQAQHTLGHKCQFNPDWIYNGRFANGYFQGIEVNVSAIENERDYNRFHILARQLNRPKGWEDSFWTDEAVAEMEAQAVAAIAKARGQS